jgi:hypothetical protein
VEPIPRGGVSDAELELLWRGGSPDLVPADAVPDPFVRHRGVLPAIYLPDAAPGPHKRWMAWVAWLLVSVFITATLLGICLTDGIPIRG